VGLALAVAAVWKEMEVGAETEAGRGWKLGVRTARAMVTRLGGGGGAGGWPPLVGAGFIGDAADGISCRTWTSARSTAAPIVCPAAAPPREAEGGAVPCRPDQRRMEAARHRA